MTVYILSSESGAALTKAIESKVRSAIPELGVIEDVGDIAQEIGAAGPVKIIVIVPFAKIESIDKLLDISGRYRDHVFFILVSKEISASDYKRLLRSGGMDWASADGQVQEILEIISRQRPTLSEAGAQAKKPTVVAFLPSAGGVGNTTIALEVAIQSKFAKTSRSWRTCYVDLDFQTSHACDFLDLEPRLQIQEIVDQPERLDQQLFGLFASHHASGLDVFAAPRSHIDLCAIKLTALDLFLGMISMNYDFIFIDLPVTWFGWTVPVLENSDVVMVTGLNTIPGLRQLKSTVEAATEAKKPSAQISIVLNRVKQNLFGGIERRAHADSVLAGQELFFVREDPDAVDRLNTGTSASQTKSGRSVKDFAALAAYCSDVKARQEK